MGRIKSQQEECVNESEEGLIKDKANALAESETEKERESKEWTGMGKN